MLPRYPDYDVLRKRQGPSWNEPSRQVVAQRLALRNEAGFFNPTQWHTLQAVCERIVPQPDDRPSVPLAAMVEQKISHGSDGYRDSRLPSLQVAWIRALDALDLTAEQQHQQPFTQLRAAQQDELLTAMQRDELSGPAWQGMSAALCFQQRLLHDICAAYYSHPTAWNELGFGGPASPRGYVRLAENSRDGWEAAQARPGDNNQARKLNRHVR
ncbi:MAG: gluconate 2-dehydrogenase subunit 3 family protein [Halopseudomonas sp.]|uniref:gluconate 2-dehydrogenase subunit 3 family protein n=1 Tax=Halopseudomonas sp. TaxID=2901191 RepID=UPI003002D38D